MKNSLVAGVALGLLGVSSLASAQDTPETWLLMGSGSAATGVGDATDDRYDLGATGGLGLYRSLMPQLQLGARVDAGALPVQNTDEEQSFDENTVGLGSLNAALRVRPLARGRDVERATGLYLEAAGGPGLVEDEAHPFLTPGAGFIFPVGDVGIGPTARYMHVIVPAGEDGTAGEDLQVATFGIELVLFDRRAPSREPPTLEQPVPEPLDRFEPASRFETAPVAADTDGDSILDADDACVSEPEVSNGINDDDGCPDSEQIQLTGDRVVIDEKAFFAYDSAELRDEGKSKLDEIVTLYEKDGDQWSALRVMGHADRRGPMPYNRELSRQRAEAVRAHLVAGGIPAALIDIEAYGETRPAVPSASTEREFQMNRRVEFLIVR